MGCGSAYFSGYGIAPGAHLAPFYFGTRPNPVRPAVVPPTFTAENRKLRYPPFVYNEPVRSTDTQFWRGPLPPRSHSNGAGRPQWARKPIQDYQVVCNADAVAQRWSDGNLLAAQPFLYQLAAEPERCACGLLLH